MSNIKKKYNKDKFLLYLISYNYIWLILWTIYSKDLAQNQEFLF